VTSKASFLGSGVDGFERGLAHPLAISQCCAFVAVKSSASARPAWADAAVAFCVEWRLPGGQRRREAASGADAEEVAFAFAEARPIVEDCPCLIARAN
jgi:hypothetical protein